MNPEILDPNQIPLIEQKHYHEPSVFQATNLLREARRQKHLPDTPVPPICVLDPDGDLLDYLHQHGHTQPHLGWACYHTRLAVATLPAHPPSTPPIGIIGRVVGASFAVLVAEELFASGCQLLISITSAGQICALDNPPYIVLIERALRDEGTSYHYRPPARYSHLAPHLHTLLRRAWDHQHLPLHSGTSWTTDAPFRETASAIAAAQQAGIATVEMEAAALYALAEATGYPIICFAHVTNQMAQNGDDFEKGADQGSHTALAIIRNTCAAWHHR